MKLLFCPHCHDVVRLVIKKWRVCACKKVGGQYNEDGLTSTLGGKNGRILGIPNPFFKEEFKRIHELRSISQKKYSNALKKFRKQYGYLHNESEAWWGEHLGDWQIMRIKNPLGPRLSQRTVLRRMMKIFKENRSTKKEIKQCLKEFNDHKKLIKEKLKQIKTSGSMI